MFVFALVGTLMATLANAKSFGPTQAEVMRAVATNVQMGIVPGSGHWIMEEPASDHGARHGVPLQMRSRLARTAGQSIGQGMDFGTVTIPGAPVSAAGALESTTRALCRRRSPIGRLRRQRNLQSLMNARSSLLI